MPAVTIYVDKPVPVQDVEFTFVYDPAVGEAVLHPPNSGQARADDGSSGDEKVL